VGRIESGKIEVGKKILLLPSKKVTSIKRIIVANEEKNTALSGENVGIVLNEDFNVKRGNVICDVNGSFKIAERVDSEIIFLSYPKGNLTAECGTKEVKINFVESPSIEIGGVTPVIIDFDEPIVVEENKERSFGILQKFVIKDDGLIIGAGVIKKVLK
jgi:sulfate adenylyltransferase subunit 1 (EFTu-like GTPase family)